MDIQMDEAASRAGLDETNEASLWDEVFYSACADAAQLGRGATATSERLEAVDWLFFAPPAQGLEMFCAFHGLSVEAVRRALSRKPDLANAVEAYGRALTARAPRLN